MFFTNVVSPDDLSKSTFYSLNQIENINSIAKYYAPIWSARGSIIKWFKSDLLFFFFQPNLD